MAFKTTEDDLEFRRHIEACEIPASDFKHREHVCLAYIYLAENNA